LARGLYTREGFELLGRQLATITRHAYFARQMDAVEQASQLMLALPLSKEQTTTARYYQAICAWKRMQYQEIEQIPEIISPAQAQVEAEPEPARARSTISLKLRRSYSFTRVLTKGITASTGVVVSTCLVLDQLAYSILPRSPPALS
jgi:hypothetical protein